MDRNTNTQIPDIITGRVWPSACARIIPALYNAAFLEAACERPMSDLSDWDVGISVGSVPGFAYANGISARDVLYTTTALIIAIFSKDPDRLVLNNALRDAQTLAQNHLEKMRSNGQKVVPMAHSVVSGMKAFLPTAEDSRYDREVLRTALMQKFGDRKIKDSMKSVFAVACGVDGNADRTTVFGYKDEKLFPDIPGRSLHFDDLSRHNAIKIANAIMYAVAFVGFMGYEKSADATYMDPGTHAFMSVQQLMDDLHDMALHARSQPATGAWSDIASGLKKLVGFKDKPQAAALISRLVVMGIGDERLNPFRGSDHNGIIINAGQIVRSTGEMVMERTFAGINKRFNAASLVHTNLPAVRQIDKGFIPLPDDHFEFPSGDIRDGRPKNVINQFDFSAAMAVDNRHHHADETVLRMRTLMHRGTISGAEADKVIAKMNNSRDIAQAKKICESITLKIDNLAKLLGDHGFDPDRYLNPEKNKKKSRSDRPAVAV